MRKGSFYHLVVVPALYNSMEAYSDKRTRLQLLEAVGWQSTARKGLGCSYLRL